MAEDWLGGLVPPLLIIIGILGIVVPVLPGLFITLVGAFVWALITSSTTGWVIFGVCVLWFAAGIAGQYLIPGRRLRQEGIGTATLLLAVLGAIAGFFVLPVIGAFVGFVGTIFLIEGARTRDRSHAWARTKVALRAVATSIGIELSAAFAIAATYAVGVFLHR
jgi:uncharacterized protein YqgC (DUF456 family)